MYEWTKFGKGCLFLQGHLAGHQDALLFEHFFSEGQILGGEPGCLILLYSICTVWSGSACTCIGRVTGASKKFRINRRHWNHIAWRDIFRETHQTNSLSLEIAQQHWATWTKIHLLEVCSLQYLVFDTCITNSSTTLLKVSAVTESVYCPVLF